MRYHRTQTGNDTSISARASELYNRAREAATNKARVLGSNAYRALQSEITRLHQAKENMGLGIESVLQKLGSALYQLRHPNQMAPALVLNRPHGQIAYRDTPYRDRARYGDSEQNIPYGLVNPSSKNKGAKHNLQQEQEGSGKGTQKKNEQKKIKNTETISRKT